MTSAPFNVRSLVAADPNASGTSSSPIRPSVFGAHQMPEPSRVPWNSGQMTWGSAGTPFMSSNGVVEFNGDMSVPPQLYKIVPKRKAENDIPSMAFAPIQKRLITDDHMAEHLNSLHISNDFTAHELQPSTSTSDTATPAEIDTMTPTFSEYRPHNVPMTTKDLQRKLRNAQRITICDQIRRMQSEPLLPGSLVQRIERPCTALVLWQPPPKVSNPLLPTPETNNNDEGAHGVDSNFLDEGIEDDYGLDNNNSSNVDLNSSMDMDL